MKLSIEVSRDDAKPEQGPARVGWFLTEKKAQCFLMRPNAWPLAGPAVRMRNQQRAALPR